MAESCELARLLRFTIQALEEHNGSVTLYKEIADLASQILTAEAGSCARGDRLNTRKEAYREETRDGFRGSREAVSCQALVRVLKCMEKAVLAGISKAKQYHDGLIPTYFIFTATSVVRTPDGPMPTAFQAEALPLFLEGPVRYLKLDVSREKKKALAEKVRGSNLYDSHLHMYKVNESLDGGSLSCQICGLLSGQRL